MRRERLGDARHDLGKIEGNALGEVEGYALGEGEGNIEGNLASCTLGLLLVTSRR